MRGPIQIMGRRDIQDVDWLIIFKLTYYQKSRQL